MNDTRREVLDALADGPASGPALAESLGVSRTAVWKHIDALREAGFAVESGDDGYELGELPEYGGLAVEHGLDAPFSVEYHESISSTNDRARELAKEGETDVTVLADEQVGGRGRLQREWNSPSGGVWLSLVLRPALPPSRAPLLTLAAAVATTTAAREAGVDAAIKWPNDVLVPDEGEERGGRKLAGILTEMEGESNRVSWVVVGIGVNANIDAAALPEGATSIRGERQATLDGNNERRSREQRQPTADGNDDESADVDRRRFVQRLLEEFDALRRDPDAIVPAWRDYAATLGKRVRVETPTGDVVGRAVDVEFPGALVVDTGDDRVRVHAGDCEHLRPV